MGEWHAAFLQGIVTLGTAAVCWWLYRRYPRPELLWWSLAWSLYVLRAGAILLFEWTRAEYWLFVRQALTGWTALALLWAAVIWCGIGRWRSAYAFVLVLPLAWSYLAIYELDNFHLAAFPAAIFLSFATLWTAWIIFRQWRSTRSPGAGVLVGVLVVWGLHHLDKPVLRARNAWNPWGYYIDILIVLGMAVGTLMLVLEELERRTAELESMSARMVSQHEDERRRVSLELHDQSAQVWAAVKLQLGLIREQAPGNLTSAVDRVLGLVDTGMRSIREVTTNLRPPLLDDLGLVPALRALVRSFGEQTHLDISFEAARSLPPVSEEAALAVYRALQEGLSNAARHSGASSVFVRLNVLDDDLVLVVNDNGRGLPSDDAGAQPRIAHAAPSHGLTGMRDRIAALHGSMEIQSTPADGTGACLTVRIPIERAAGR